MFIFLVYWLYLIYLDEFLLWLLDLVVLGEDLGIVLFVDGVILFIELLCLCREVIDLFLFKIMYFILWYIYI